MASHRKSWKRTRARDIVRCTAGLLRFATPREMDALLDHLSDDRVQRLATGHGMPNRVVLEALLRRGRVADLDFLVQQALLVGDPPSLLGRLLDLDDPQVNATLLGADGVLTRLPRNLRRQLAHQTSRRDGVTPVRLPDETLAPLYTRRQSSLDHVMLYAADPVLAGDALRRLGGGADPHGAVWACRTLLDAHRVHEVGELVEQGRLPAFRWGPDGSEPSVLAYALAALKSVDGERRLRELAGRVRRPEMLRSIAEIADTDACEPWRDGRSLVRTVVNRRHPGIPRVDWAAVGADTGPISHRVARFILRRTDAPPALVMRTVVEHPELAVLIADPAPEVLAALCGWDARVGADVILKVVGNGLVAGTFDAEFVVGTVPKEVLRVVADALWLPGLRGTARIRILLGLDGDVRLTPAFVDETGLGRTRRLREPGVRAHWDPGLAYGRKAGDLFREGTVVTADEVLWAADPDPVLAPTEGLPDPRVLRRLAEHVDRHLGGRPEAWLAALTLLEEGYVGSFPELLVTAGEVTS
ncbi:hypothetical protein BZB76_6639 [Actinomadura pelletieri DSM 43383]|uniref:Uncharacterized protein n=1 Tax=Actinomadura pelletieri DSM 43383 TaxID=1120940 RepID=A0A495QAN1_9ACTN|nr:hypothetical protein [Actinomadura pelletieri]RKS68376.1 hypothetical protein BZB76_6639 [Actinomadura pelletieri DSM 43383]